MSAHRVAEPGASTTDPVLDIARIILMANQIGDFFAPYPPERRAEGIRNHLRTYWDPRMRNALLDYIEGGGKELSAQVIEGALLLLSPEQRKGYYGPPTSAHQSADHTIADSTPVVIRR